MSFSTDMDLDLSQINKFFNELAPSSLKKIKNNIENERARLEIERYDLDLDDSLPKSKLKQSKKTKLKFPDKEFLAGRKLPRKYRFLLPRKLFGNPIEELDDFYKCEYVNILDH